MAKKYLLTQDDCAPDSLEKFEEDLYKEVGFYLRDFKTFGKKIEFGYLYSGYVLEMFPDRQYWHLSIYN